MAVYRDVLVMSHTRTYFPEQQERGKPVSTEYLNQINEQTLRGIVGDGVEIDRFGDSAVVRTGVVLPGAEAILFARVIEVVDGNLLLCNMLDRVEPVGEDNFILHWVSENALILKPLILQAASWLNRTVPYTDGTGVYYDDVDADIRFERRALYGAISTEKQAITPAYEIGGIISCRADFIGRLMDRNEDGRNWAALEGGA